jgi:uncharacterized glyoxalase superfamily protein PhnB
MIKGNLAPMLSVRDVRRSVEFYRDVLGFELVGWWDDHRSCYITNWTGPGDPDFAELRAGQLTVHLHAAGDEFEHDPSGSVVLHVEVEDADRYHRHIQDNGGRSERPKDQPWGWRQFFLTDPDGHRWAFHHVIPER